MNVQKFLRLRADSMASNVQIPPMFYKTLSPFGAEAQKGKSKPVKEDSLALFSYLGLISGGSGSGEESRLSLRHRPPSALPKWSEPEHHSSSLQAINKLPRSRE